MTERHTDAPLAIDAATAKISRQRKIDALIQASPSVVLLRDGELVLYRRTRSLLDQCRFKLADGKWHRFSTRRASLENAMAAACDRNDEARYRQRLGLAYRTPAERYAVRYRINGHRGPFADETWNGTWTEASVICGFL
jgi:hypothetical protein